MTQDVVTPAVDAVLKAQQQGLETLQALLRTEHDALLRADASALPDLASRKSKLFEELQSLETQRIALFAAVGGRASALQAAWNPVRALAQAVAAENQHNGAMIAALMRNTEGALQVLRGVPDATPVYGPQGYSAGPSGSSRPLASA